MAIREIKIFLASSSELDAERDVVHKLKDEVGKEFPHLKLELVKWETDLPSGSVSGNRIQDDINPLLEGCEIVFVLFYSKAGDFTVEELRLAEAQGKKVFVYFKKGFTTQDPSKLAAYSRALDLREQLIAENRILFRDYSDERDFEKIFKEDLPKHLRLLENPPPPTIPISPNPTLQGFRTLQSVNINFRDLDEYRPLPTDPEILAYYFDRPSDREIRDALANPARRFIVVKGGPLAGKTRAVIEAVKRWAGGQLLLPQIEQVEHWELELTPSFSGNLLIFDDFDIVCDQLGKAKINNLLHVCFKHGVRVLATCRKGGEFAILEQTIEERLWENALIVEVKKLEKVQFEVIERDFSARNIHLDRDAYRRLDYNVGSLFLDLRTMRKRYWDYAKDDLACAILQTLKVFFIGFNYRLDRSYEREKIMDYIQRYYRTDFPPAKWRAAWQKLDSTDRGDGFIVFNREGNILIEDAYLRVVVDNMAPADCEREILDLFPKPDDRRAFGFFGVKFWTVRLNEEESLTQSEALKFIEDMEAAGVQANEVTFTSLINKATNAEAARFWLVKMRAAGVQPNDVTFNSLINKAADAAEARLWLEEMRQAGVQPDYVTFNSLIGKAADAAEARQWYAEMRQMNIDPTFITFNSLINKAADAAEARLWLEEMRAAGIQPDDVTFTSLINKAADAAEARLWLEEMRATGAQPDEVTFNSLINKATDAVEAREWLAEMMEAKIRPDIFTVSSLLKKCGKDCEGIRWVESIREEYGIRVNDFYFRQLESTRRRLGC